MDKIAIILINYNSSKDTIDCIESIVNSKMEKIFVDIVVVDNKSSYEQLKILEAYYNTNQFVRIRDNLWRYYTDCYCIHLILHNENKGFSGGNNIGLKYASESLFPDFYWILNNDTIISEDAIQQLLCYSKKNPNCVLGSTILYYYNKNTIQCAGGFKYNDITCRQRMLENGTKIDNLNSIHISNIDCVSGCSIFFDSTTFKRIGYLDEDYFLYYEEMNLRQICAKEKIKRKWCKQAIIWHKEGQSTGKKINGTKSLLSEYYGNLSALTYYYKHYRYLYYCIRWMKYLKKLIVFSINKDFERLNVLHKSYKDFDLKKESIRRYV